MSDEKKDFEDKAEDAFDKVKEEAKEFGKKAEEAANDFKEDVKNTFDPNNPGSGKTVAIIAHITVIGWIIALIMNSQNKTEFGSYYIRQTLGIWILGFLLGIIPIIGCFAFIICVVLIIISLVNAANGKMVPIVGLGQQFQDWFKSL